MSSQSIAHFLYAWGFSYLLTGPLLRGTNISYTFRFGPILCIGVWHANLAQNWKRPNPIFHEIITQPAPHGSYVRKSLREHFPVWWHNCSETLYKQGYNLPEMNEYDKQTKIERSSTAFDNQIL